MEDQKIILCDTNILIEFYKKNPSIVKELSLIGQRNIAISIVSVGELIYGAINKRELNHILKDINHLNVLHLTEEIGETFFYLMSNYALSHKISVPDALIAATALSYQIPLYTLNLKDFIYIPELQFYKSPNPK